MSIENARRFLEKAKEDEYEFFNYISSDQFDCTIDEIETVMGIADKKRTQQPSLEEAVNSSLIGLDLFPTFTAHGIPVAPELAR